jgi:hypothetical protein
LLDQGGPECRERIHGAPRREGNVPCCTAEELHLAYLESTPSADTVRLRDVSFNCGAEDPLASKTGLASPLRDKTRCGWLGFPTATLR